MDLVEAYAKKKENIQRIILELTGKNDRTLSLCLKPT